MKNRILKLSQFVLVCIALQMTAFNASAELPYNFEEVIQLSRDDCPQGSSCLLQSYLAVALFSDREVDGRQVGILLEDYFYCHDATGHVYRAPVGLETDFLSIPELGQHAIRPKDFMEAAVVHDWLYATGDKGKKSVADKIFHHILKEQGVGLTKREIMYQAVRWFGKSAYGTKDEIPIVDVVTKERITPSPIQRPVTTIIATIDCTDKDAFEIIRSTHRSPYMFQPEIDQSFKHKGFYKEVY